MANTAESGTPPSMRRNRRRDAAVPGELPAGPPPIGPIGPTATPAPHRFRGGAPPPATSPAVAVARRRYRGEVLDYADIARLGYVTRARITQVMNLLNLAPDIQEELLTSSPLGTEAAVPERGLRHVTAVVGWSHQRKLWKELLGKPSTQH